MEKQLSGVVKLSSKVGRKTLISFCVFTLGIVLNFSGYLAVINLQSSINIEDGVGIASITATYVTAAVFGVAITPIMVRKLGPKACVLISELSYLVYVVVNYYPVAYVLIPAGIIAGIGEATLWPTMVLFVVYFAKNYAQETKQNPEVLTMRFLGYFYFSFQSSQVIGNMLSYSVLFAGKSPLNATNTSVEDYSFCGANDCQDPDIIKGNQDQYQPATEQLLYIVIGVLAGVIALAMLIHFFFAQNFDSTMKDIGPVNLDSKSNEKSQDEEGIISSIITILKATLKHVVNPKCLLITPLTIYLGIFIAFGFSELTRAFGSCMLGVDQIGLLAAISGTCGAFSSFLGTKLANKYGRTLIFFIEFCLDMTVYLVCLLWVPTSETLWLVYFLFGLLGTSTGMSQAILSDMHTYYFPNNQDIALVVWNLWTIIGIAIQTGWSVSLCVNVKIYIQIGILCVSMLGYGLSKHIYYGKTKVKKELISYVNSTAL